VENLEPAATHHPAAGSEYTLAARTIHRS